MFQRLSLLAFALSAARAQKAGSVTAEVHPTLSWKSCTTSGGCTTVNGAITLDSNWRWSHDATANSYTNCYTGNSWNATLCPSNAVCATNCALEGAAYTSTYGITASGDSLKLNLVTTSTQKSVGSRVYLLANDTRYQTFNLLNKEFTFDVDMSGLPCGLNGAVYTVEMPADGGLSSTNTAGAKYGTGYCDSQCPHDIKWIGGQANAEGWTPSTNSNNTGSGKYGACCAEMDLWEANSMAAAYTPHPCTQAGLTKCEGTTCGDGDNRYGGICDKDGCDFNSFRQGDKTFLGPGSSFKIDTTKKITVVTQFITSGGSLSEIKRKYMQNGVVFENSQSTQPSGYNSISTAYCSAQKTLFGDTNSFSSKGGLAGMGASLARGHVLVLSLWDDYAVNMLWLDSTYPTTGSTSTPGVARGTCPTTSGVPSDVESQYPNASVTYSNIRFGDIGSTTTGGTGTTTTGGTVTNTGTTSNGGCTVPKWGQCGGQGYTGCSTCASGSTCKFSNQWYSQCL